MDGEQKSRVLIVDDEKVFRDLLARFLHSQVAQVKTAENGFTAVKLAESEQFDLVFMDIRMPGMDGIRTFGELKKINPNLRCVFMSSDSADIELLKGENKIYLKKPFADLNQIREVMDKVLLEGLVPAAQTFEERRAYARFNIPLEVEYKARGSDAPFKQVVSKNISPLGIGLYIRESLPLGTNLDMVIKLSGAKLTYILKGVVLWTQKCEEKPGFFVAGVSLTETDLSHLITFLIDSGQLPADGVI